MPRAISISAGVAAVVVFFSGGSFVASAMQAGGGGPPPRDPTKITIIKRPYDTKQLVAQSTLTESAYRGRTVWLQRCAYCHDGVGQPSYNTLGSWLGAETIQTLGDVAFRAIVGAGTERMPGFRYTLKPQQMDDLVAFLNTVTPDKKPTPAQLAGRAELTSSGQ